MSEIPLQQDCDPGDPEEMALWALMCLPGMESQAAMLMPPQVLSQWSRRLWDLGFRHNPELQELKYVPPQGGQHWLDAAAGRWVPIDQPLPPEVTAPSTDHLSHEEKMVLGERLKAEGFVPADDPHIEGSEDMAEIMEVNEDGD